MCLTGAASLFADLARDRAGHPHALILHGHKPAQSAHVVAPAAGSAWLPLDPAKPLTTPFPGEFGW